MRPRCSRALAPRFLLMLALATVAHAQSFQGGVRGRRERLNPLNIVQWVSLASNSLGNASFGQLRDQANNMRSVQFTLRLSY
ncbi:MAG TPA: hypothetical protein VM032_01800 [Vicinamibacterales bacterium]|nr:hypothetical protein [Vicinamibacterales bacterium]